MPVARSVSASQLSREAPVSPVSTPTGDSSSVPLIQQKAHTLDRFSKPCLLNGHNETRRKRTFMSFRLSKKSGKRKDGAPGGLTSCESVAFSALNCGGGGGGGDCGDSLDGGGSDSSSAASVKPKRRHLTRVGSFVRSLASRVQAAGPVLPPPPLRPKTTPPSSVSSSPPHKPVLTNGTTNGATDGGDGGDSLNSGGAVSSSVVTAVPVSPSPPPQDYVLFAQGKVPAMMGLRNHGNTCFINAVVQCLNHTDMLAEYFVLDAYKQDLRRCNRLGNRKTSNGAKRGEMTEQVAAILKSLWSLRYVPDVSLALKSCVDRHEASYRGGSQHDAAEFLMFLLGKVHDDLNTASKRKYKKIKNSYGRPDEVVASETLNNHLRCNSSFVQDIFQAQFRSSLRCPHCQKESNTFDPFMCVSLPIPHKEMMPVYVTIVYLNQQPKQVCLGMSAVCGSSCGTLRAAVAQDCGLDLESLILTEVDGSGFHRTFADEVSVDCIGSGGSVYAIELPVESDLRPPVQDDGPFLLLTWVNAVKAEPDNIRFGGVYQSQVARDISYQDLQKLLLKEMTTMVTVHTLTTKQQCGLFRVLVCDGSVEGASIAAGVELPLYSQCVDQALALCCPRQPQHLKLLLLWDEADKEKYIVDGVDHVEQHSSVEELKSNPPQPPPTTLADCLKLHSSAEQLSSGDAWHCPTCDRKQQGVKRLMLWSAPPILVLHLKRFRQSGVRGCSSSKLSTFVTCPLREVDISEYVAQRSSQATSAAVKQLGSGANNKISQENTKNSDTSKDNGVAKPVSGLTGGMWSPWRKPKRMLQQQPEDKHVYDLYAVCNHHGKDLQGGHYTAGCYNPSSGEWYLFDDSRVQQLKSDKVVSQDAYLLFYQRRSGSGTVSTLETAQQKQHWSYRIPRDSLPASLNPPLSKQQQSVKGESKEETGNSTSASSTPATAASANSSPVLAKANSSSLGTVVNSCQQQKVTLERGRSYGTLPCHGSRGVLQSQDSTERDHCSDTEAPWLQEESPVKKKRISDVQERRESELEEEEDELEAEVAEDVDSPMETSAPESPASAALAPTTNRSATKDLSSGQRQTETLSSVAETIVEETWKADTAATSSMAELNGSALMNGTGAVSSVGVKLNQIETVLEFNYERRNSNGSKTVLISRNQAIDSKDSLRTCSCLTLEKKASECSCSKHEKDVIVRPHLRPERDTGRHSSGDVGAILLHNQTKSLSISKNSAPATTASAGALCTTTSTSFLSNTTAHLGPGGANSSGFSRSTPDVVIQPASPAVLAAHKRSVITVTLRQRSPSASSQPISRSPSSCSNASRTSRASATSRISSCSNNKMSNASSMSSFSPETLASIITVNGVTLADNEQLSAEFANSLAVAAASTSINSESMLGSDSMSSNCDCGEIDSQAICCSGKDILSKGFIGGGGSSRASLRNSHNNKTASYVHVNSPVVPLSTSPRPNGNRGRATGGGRSPNGSSSNPTRSKTPSNRTASSPNGASQNGYSQYIPSVASRNSHNTARTTLDSVPCKNNCSKSSAVSSNGCGTISYSMNGGSDSCNGYTKSNFSNSVVLRNSSENFGILESACDVGASGCNCTNNISSGTSKNSIKLNCYMNGSSSSQVNGMKSNNVNRYSSGSLDGGSSRKMSCCGQNSCSSSSSRPRYGSECLTVTHNDRSLTSCRTDHHHQYSRCYSAAAPTRCPCQITSSSPIPTSTTSACNCHQNIAPLPSSSPVCSCLLSSSCPTTNKMLPRDHKSSVLPHPSAVCCCSRDYSEDSGSVGTSVMPESSV